MDNVNNEFSHDKVNNAAQSASETYDTNNTAQRVEQWRCTATMKEAGTMHEPFRLRQSREQNNGFGVILLDNVNWQLISTITSFWISRVFENNAVLQQSEGRC